MEKEFKLIQVITGTAVILIGVYTLVTKKKGA